MLSRWMNVVSERVVPPIGPTCVPVACTVSQAIAFGLTVAEAMTFPHTMLVSFESRQVTRMGRLSSSGFGLKKCVMS